MEKLSRRNFFKKSAIVGTGLVLSPNDVTDKEQVAKAVNVNMSLDIDDDVLISIERQIRMYVKSTGGFRKDLHESDRNHAQNLLNLVKRKEVEWDCNIHVPGFENVEYRLLRIQAKE